jgi:hypothetical protein
VYFLIFVQLRSCSPKGRNVNRHARKRGWLPVRPATAPDLPNGAHWLTGKYPRGQSVLPQLDLMKQCATGRTLHSVQFFTFELMPKKAFIPESATAADFELTQRELLQYRAYNIIGLQESILTCARCHGVQTHSPGAKQMLSNIALAVCQHFEEWENEEWEKLKR